MTSVGEPSEATADDGGGATATGTATDDTAAAPPATPAEGNRNGSGGGNGETESAAEAPDRSIDQGRPWYWSEPLLALELGGLAAFAFGRPTLDTFGRSPDTFVARGADAATIVAFGLTVALGPLLALGVLGLLGRPFGPRVRRWVHLVLVAIVGGLAVWQLGQGITGYPPESQKLMIAGVIGGLALAALRSTVGSVTSFLRLMGVASVVFLIQFLFMSPTSGMVTGDGPALDDDVSRAVAADLGDDPPDVVVVLFDALPTASLLDGNGQVDAELFPNFARVASTSTWYRNNTTIASFTAQAVPAILTGRFRPEGTEFGRLAESDDENLFTLLGGSYELHVKEQITRLCPRDICPESSGGGLGPLLGDAVETWVGGTSGGTEKGEFDVPGALGDDRFVAAEQWQDDQAPRTPQRPQLQFHHVILPHYPWAMTDDGTLYRPADRLPTGTFGLGWTDSGIPVGLQRHTLQLQAADRLLGDLLDRLEADDRFDDSMVVVTADHGNAFMSGQLQRGLSEENAEQVMWAPLFVKAPGQTAPQVDDGNVMSIDVLPTIAHTLGVDLPWDVDGVPLDDPAERRDDDTKYFQYNKNNVLQPLDGEVVMEIDDTDERFQHMLTLDLTEGTGADAVWRRTPHGGLFGLRVDDLTVGQPYDGEIDVEHLGDVQDSGSDRPMIEVVGDAALPEGTYVAYALNGTIGAVTSVEPGVGGGDGLVHGLLPPRLFDEGGNELTAYVVEGAVGAEVLRPIEVGDAG